MQEAKVQFDIDTTGAGGRLRDGTSVVEASNKFCLAFGGCSFAFGSGCWMNPSGAYEFDAHVEFRVGLNTHDEWLAFRWLASKIGAAQKAIYLVSPSGLVEVFPTDNAVFFDPARPEFRKAVRGLGVGAGPLDVLVFPPEVAK